ncbi:MAG: ABC transporter substrate-binding protein [Myxococcales bacterium]|nr:MAG: ABC transporter substrate-binding protein [Myxococcales bacterium]
MKIRAIQLLLAILLLWLPTSGALAKGQDAVDFLKKKHAEVEKLLPKSKANNPELSDKLKQALNNLLDYEELSKRSLARHWNERSASERKQFVDLLRQLVQRNYEQNLSSTQEYKIKYHESRKEKDGVIVRTTAKSKVKKRAPELTIEYSLHPEGDAWKVYDVTTDGVSLVRNYRSQFGRIIRKEGWDDLISRMKKRLQDGSEI